VALLFIIKNSICVLGSRI